MRKVLVVLLSAVLYLTFAVSICAADAHTVISEKPLYLTDGLTGHNYNFLEGDIHISWTDFTRYGYFYAKVIPFDSPIKLEYEFILVAVGTADKSEIEGLWDIKINGSLVAEGIVGKLYSLTAPVGDYFKFYGGDSQCNTMVWHLSGYVTDRFDF